MLRAIAHSLTCSAVWLISTQLLSAQSDWPEFRGPTADGKTAAQLPVDFGNKNLKWSVPIHGKGWSSPVVWGNQIWLTTATRDGKKMSAICVDTQTGNILHDKVIHENESPAFCHPTNSYASPTPAIENGRVYLHFGSYGTTCLDTKTGKQIWQRLDFECDHYRGPGSSPILFEDLLIVAFDGADKQYVAAMDKSTGKTVWKTDREIEYGTDVGDYMKACGTGAIFEIDGEPILVYPSAVATIAYHARTGKPVWTCYHQGMNASARPLRAKNGLVFISNGMGKMIAVDPSGKGDITKDIAWTQTRAVAKKPSQLLIGDHLHMINDQGIISCLNVETGEPVWQHRFGSNFSASPISDGKNIVAISESGDVIVWKADSESFQLVTKTKLGDGWQGFNPSRFFETVLYCQWQRIIAGCPKLFRQNLPAP